MSKVQELEDLLRPTVQALGYELWGIEYTVGRQRTPHLYVYIDRENGVLIDDVETVHHQLSGVLDVDGAVPENYILDVSSPGLDRILFKEQQYVQNIGEQIDVRLFVPVQGTRRIRGQLKSVTEGSVTVDSTDGEYTISLHDVRRARIVPEF